MGNVRMWVINITDVLFCFSILNENFWNFLIKWDNRIKLSPHWDGQNDSTLQSALRNKHASFLNKTFTPNSKMSWTSKIGCMQFNTTDCRWGYPTYGFVFWFLNFWLCSHSFSSGPKNIIAYSEPPYLLGKTHKFNEMGFEIKHIWCDYYLSN